MQSEAMRGSLTSKAPKSPNSLNLLITNLLSISTQTLPNKQLRLSQSNSQIWPQLHQNSRLQWKERLVKKKCIPMSSRILLINQICPDSRVLEMYRTVALVDELEQIQHAKLRWYKPMSRKWKSKRSRGCLSIIFEASTQTEWSFFLYHILNHHLKIE